MKKGLFYSIVLVFVVFQMSAQQYGRYGHLTIFSEDGDKFTLVLNGETINDVPQTNLRVEELTQPYYNARIIFEDASKTSITKNNLLITDVNGNFQDVTYKIRRDKNNSSKMKMNFFSMTDVNPEFLPPSNVQVIHYGRPVQTGGTVTQTTTTTSTGGVSAGVSVNGVGVNISVNDPNMQVTQTTTTTSSSSYGGHHDGPRHGRGPRCSNQYAMSSADFSSALQTIKNQGFEETKLKTAKQIVKSNCLNTHQIAEICKTFGYDESRLDFAKEAYESCTEPNNYFKINNVFSFSSSAEELSEYVSSR